MSNLRVNRIAWIVVAAVTAGLFSTAGCSNASSDGKEAKGGGGGGPVVLKVGDRTFTLEELDEKGMTFNLKPYQDLYEHRRQVVEQLINDMLLDQEAAKRSISRDELLRVEVTDKAAEIPDADVTAFYEQNKVSMGGRPLDDDLRVQIRQFLGQQRRAFAHQTFVKQLREGVNVEVLLDAPRVNIVVADGEPAKGPANAPVTIVEYSDFQCPYCAKVGPTLERIAQAYPDKVRIVFRDFPLPMHPEAQPAAEAAKCAQEQGQFWAYHDKLFLSQAQLGGESYKKFAEELGLDAQRFAACYDEGKYRQDVMVATRDGQQHGVTGTPAFFVNGRFFSGAMPFERFQAVIEEELAGATKRSES